MSERLHPQPLNWDDVPRIHDLVSRRRAADVGLQPMRIGDFYWTLRNTADGHPLSDAWLWPRPDGSLDAFAWLDPPRGDVIAAPDAAASMLDDALDRLEEQARHLGRKSLEVVALQGDRQRVEALSRRAYTKSEQGNVRFSMPLGSLPDAAPVPPGFSLRHVSEELDVDRRVFVETTSFGSLTPTADTWRLLMRRLSTYRRELDLIAVAPDGAGASACTVWYDAAARCGELEAVGTSPANQRRGIGKAVIIEGLRRLHGLGATQAVVETTIGNVAAIALYRSCGFELVAEDHGWTKRL